MGCAGSREELPEPHPYEGPLQPARPVQLLGSRSGGTGGRSGVTHSSGRDSIELPNRSAQHDNEIAVVTAARTARDRAVEDFHNEPEESRGGWLRPSHTRREAVPLYAYPLQAPSAAEFARIMEEQGTGPAFRREAAKSQQSMERRQKAAAATVETH
ncbi:hypothetical protein LTR09_005949 [Extremus antarcticus]|uniref:Uncharacterized protein n=1 Tax=Extremus antarcticus TaxID=702011 RepID=A0AAJ0GBX0_9PEZI|nr:hypothetical protein LTR09_005949 [Extremus antarcticus]